MHNKNASFKKSCQNILRQTVSASLKNSAENANISGISLKMYKKKSFTFFLYIAFFGTMATVS